MRSLWVNDKLLLDKGNYNEPQITITLILADDVFKVKIQVHLISHFITTSFRDEGICSGVGIYNNIKFELSDQDKLIPMTPEV